MISTSTLFTEHVTKEKRRDRNAERPRNCAARERETFVRPTMRQPAKQATVIWLLPRRMIVHHHYETLKLNNEEERNREAIHRRLQSRVYARMV